MFKSTHMYAFFGPIGSLEIQHHGFFNILPAKTRKENALDTSAFHLKNPDTVPLKLRFSSKNVINIAAYVGCSLKRRHLVNTRSNVSVHKKKKKKRPAAARALDRQRRHAK